MSETAPSTDQPSGSVDLTAREIEILRRLSGGRIYKDVAPELFISVGTLKNHVHRILTKTGTRKLFQAIDVARREGLLPDEEGFAGKRSSTAWRP